MKKYLPILFVIAIATLSGVEGQAQTNVYHPFPEDSAIWVVNWYAQPPYCNGYCNTDIYRMYGDTVINSVSYNKLFAVSFVYQGPYTNPPPNYFSGTYIGAIRQDSINKKVYYRKYLMTSDTLLYDFDLAIGDTLPATYINNSLFKPTIVSGIDSMLVDNKYHKLFTFYNTAPYQAGHAYLLEGVGAGGGLFDLLDFFEGGPILECFSATNTQSCEYYLVDINETTNETLFKISPNPFTTSTTIEVKGNKVIGEISCEMYDVYGRQVRNFRPQTSTFKLERSGLPSGLYFIRITALSLIPSPSGGGTQGGGSEVIATEKIIITDN